MKSSISHLILITVITTMASLHTFGQKRFDNIQTNRKIVITKSGPKSVTEKWIPNVYDSVNTPYEVITTTLYNSKTTTVEVDSTACNPTLKQGIASSSPQSKNLAGIKEDLEACYTDIRQIAHN